MIQVPRAAASLAALLLLGAAPGGGAFSTPSRVWCAPAALQRSGYPAFSVKFTRTSGRRRRDGQQQAAQMRRTELEGEIQELQREQERIAAVIADKQVQLAQLSGGQTIGHSANSTRILVIVPFPLDEKGIANRRRQAEALDLRPETQLDFRPIKAGCTSFMSDHDWLLMDIGVYEAGYSFFFAERGPSSSSSSPPLQIDA